MKKVRSDKLLCKDNERNWVATSANDLLTMTPSPSLRYANGAKQSSDKGSKGTGSPRRYAAREDDEKEGRSDKLLRNNDEREGS